MTEKAKIKVRKQSDKSPDVVTLPRDVWEKSQRQIEDLKRVAKGVFERLELLEDNIKAVKS